MLYLIQPFCDERAAAAEKIFDWIKGYRGVLMRRISISGAGAALVEVAGGDRETGRGEKNARYAVKILSEYSGVKVCFRDDFKYSALFEKAGFTAAGQSRFWEMAAWPIIEATAPYGGSAALLSPAADRKTAVLAMQLCRRFRNIYLFVPDSGRLREMLFREKGVSVAAGGPEASEEWSAAVFFAPPPDKLLLSDNCTVVSSSEKFLENVRGGRTAIKASWSVKGGGKPFPPGYPPETMASWANECGMLSGEQIEIEKVFF